MPPAIFYIAVSVFKRIVNSCYYSYLLNVWCVCVTVCYAELSLVCFSYFNIFQLSTVLNSIIKKVGKNPTSFYLAYSVARVSRITVTLMCPGYSSSFSILSLMSRANTVACKSLIFSGLTITRTSRPA